MFGKKSDKAPESWKTPKHVQDQVKPQVDISTDTEETKCSTCDFETIYPQQLRYHEMKHKIGQKIMEQQSRAHERYVKKGYMSEHTAVACKVADRYMHLTIDMQDQEQIQDFLTQQWRNLDSQQQLEFVRYLAGRLCVVGHQLDQMALQPKVVRLG